jgi:ABC-type uncharacterized transport system substrate-binding protein
MKKIFFPILVSLFLQAMPVMAGDVLVVQSFSIKPYNEALQGFKAISSAGTHRLISADMSESAVIDVVRSDRPDLILAIGMDALLKVRAVRNIPIVYLMVLNAQPLVHDNENVTGVDMAIRPELQLATFRQILPHAGRILLPFDPAKSGAFVKAAQNAAAAMGIELLARKVSSSREAVTLLNGMRGKIDALWLLPDTTVVTSATIDLLLLSAIEREIPVLTFSEKYAEKGALLSLEVDAAEAGRQAGEMARMILAGTAIKNIDKAYCRGMIPSINLIVAKKLGIPIAGNVLRQSRVIK